MQPVKVIIIGSSDTNRTALIKAVSEAGVVATEQPVFGYPNDEGHVPDMELGRVTLPGELVVYLFGLEAKYLEYLSPQVFSEGVVGAVVLGDGLHFEALQQVRASVAFMLERSDAAFVVAMRGVRFDDPAHVVKMRGEMGFGEEVALVAWDSNERSDAKRIIAELIKQAIGMNMAPA